MRVSLSACEHPPPHEPLPFSADCLRTYVLNMVLANGEPHPLAAPGGSRRLQAAPGGKPAPAPPNPASDPRQGRLRASRAMGGGGGDPPGWRPGWWGGDRGPSPTRPPLHIVSPQMPSDSPLSSDQALHVVVSRYLWRGGGVGTHHGSLPGSPTPPTTGVGGGGPLRQWPLCLRT